MMLDPFLDSNEYVLVCHINITFGEIVSPVLFDSWMVSSILKSVGMVPWREDVRASFGNVLDDTQIVAWFASLIQTRTNIW